MNGQQPAWIQLAREFNSKRKTLEEHAVPALEAVYDRRMLKSGSGIEGPTSRSVVRVVKYSRPGMACSAGGARKIACPEGASARDIKSEEPETSCGMTVIPAHAAWSQLRAGPLPPLQ